MIRFYPSKNNQVWLIRSAERCWIRRIFLSEKQAAAEALLLLKLDPARIIKLHGRCLDMRYIRGERLDQWIECCEKVGNLDRNLGAQLYGTCCEVFEKTGKVCLDQNLRNFIVTPYSVARIDLESAQSGDFFENFALLGAYILLNDPQGSWVKYQLVEQMEKCLPLTVRINFQQQLAVCQRKLLEQRALRK